MSDFANLDFTKVEDEKGFGPMPVGEYTLMVDEVTKNTTAKGDGEYLKVKYRVVEPTQYSKRFVWDNINIKNPNEKAVAIGLSRLKKMFTLTGTAVEEIKTLTERDLVGKKYKAFLGHEDFNGKTSERVKSLSQAPTTVSMMPTDTSIEIPF